MQIVLQDVGLQGWIKTVLGPVPGFLGLLLGLELVPGFLGLLLGLPDLESGLGSNLDWSRLGWGRLGWGSWKIALLVLQPILRESLL